MAIINCPKCHKYISSLLKVCPECGCNVADELALLKQQSSALDRAEEQESSTDITTEDATENVVSVDPDATVIVDFDDDERVDFDASQKHDERPIVRQTEPTANHQTSSQQAAKQPAENQPAENLQSVRLQDASQQSASQQPQVGIVPKVVKTVPGLHKKNPNSAGTASAGSTANPSAKPQQTGSEPIGKVSSQQKPTGTNKPKQKMSLRRKIIYYFAAIVVIGVISLYFIDRHRTASYEERAFAMLDSCEDLRWYEDYMVRFPDGPHINEVKNMYSEAKSDFADFIKIASHGSKTDVLAFLKSHPDTRFRHRCLNRIDSLDWRKAKSVNTLASYKKYLAEHAEGVGIFSDDAREAIDRIKKQTVSDTDTEILTGSIKSFLSAMNSGNASRIDDLIAESFSFNGEGNVDGDVVVQFYNDKYLAEDEDDKDVRFKLKDKPTMKREKGDEDQEIFVVTAKLIDANSKDTVDVDTWSLKMKFNSERKLSEVTLK